MEPTEFDTDWERMWSVMTVGFCTPSTGNHSLKGWPVSKKNTDQEDRVERFWWGRNLIRKSRRATESRVRKGLWWPDF